VRPRGHDSEKRRNSKDSERKSVRGSFKSSSEEMKIVQRIGSAVKRKTGIGAEGKSLRTTDGPVIQALAGAMKTEDDRRKRKGGDKSSWKEMKNSVKGRGVKKRHGGRRAVHESVANWRRSAKSCGRMRRENGHERLLSESAERRRGGNMLR